MKNVIEILNLNKSYGTVKAVQDLSFRVKEGELFAFLGINGAGKSTTINILCGQLPKDGGSVLIDGIDLEDLKILFAKLYTTMVEISNKALSESKNGEKATN